MELKTKTIQNIDEDDTENLSKTRRSKKPPKIKIKKMKVRGCMRANLKTVGGSR